MGAGASSARGRAAIQFGTDGWRGIIADDFTFENVVRVTRATAACWSQGSAWTAGARPLVVVGADRRFLSPEFAATVAREFAAAGFEVILGADAVPTPAVSHAVRRLGAVGGVMITASHNPPRFNGYKLKAAYGGPAGGELAKAIEARLEDSDPEPPASCPGEGRVRVRDLVGPYVSAVRRQVDLGRLRRVELRVAHDAMHGTGAGVLEAVVRGTRCRVTSLRGERDPMFGGINPEPIARNYAATARWLRSHPHDLCLVTDGDADRLGLMDGRGRALTTHQAIGLVLHHLIRNRGERGRLVTTLNTTRLVLELAAAEGLAVTEVPIGFKHLCAEMLRGDVLAGVEESGSIGLARHLPERDGILAGALVLELLATEPGGLGRILRRLEREFGPHRYARLDVPIAAGQGAAVAAWCLDHDPGRLAGRAVAGRQTFDGVKYLAADGSWLMVRASGTEPVVRVYAEGPTEAVVDRLIAEGRRMVRQAIGGR